ncbi:MAG: ADOP family duplicated permease, partial [Gemmatimonadales bacterium]
LMVLPNVRTVNRAGPRPADRVLDLIDIVEMRTTFASAAAYAVGGLNLADPDRPRRLRVGVVSSNFFTTMAADPIRGRGLVATDGVPGAPPVAILSYGLWQEHFGGASVIGTRIGLSGTSYQIIGIMPRGFSFPERSELWIPLSVPIAAATWEAFGMGLSARVVARLADGVTLPAAQQRLLLRWHQALASASGTQRANLQSYLDDMRTRGVLVPLQRELTAGRERALLILFGATGLLLVIACANVINLLISQAIQRRREVAMREVLGATRSRLVRQLLTESISLSMIGGLTGLALARPALQLITTLLPPSLTAVAPPTLDVRVLLFALATATVTGMLAGLWPALRSSRADPGAVIKHGSHGSGGDAVDLHFALVACEVAFTTMLLIGTGLMLRSLQRVLGLDRGIDIEHLATARIAFPRSTGNSIRLERMNAMATWLASQRGIVAAGFVNDLPISGDGLLMDFTPGQTAVPRKADDPGAHWLMASPGYFAAAGITLRRGRLFRGTDDSLSPPVAIISESIAERYWPGSDAVGKTIQMGEDPVATIVGVVADVRERLTGDPLPQLYFPLAATPQRQVSLLVRGSLPRSALLGRLTAAVRYADPSQATYDVRMMDEVLSDATTPWRDNAVLTAAFAALALLMATFGVYAVVAHAIGRRKGEFGIRSALGAASGDLLWLSMRRMLSVTALGLLVGLGGAWAASRAAASLMYGIGVHDAVTFAAAPLLVAIPVVIATLAPARRATHVNPAEVMRAE